MGCGLRREVESMLDFAADACQDKLHLRLWSRPLHAFGTRFTYEIIRPVEQCMFDILCVGIGKTKREALESFLSRWRNGEVDLQCPAQSKEELRVKMDLLGKSRMEEKESYGSK